MRRHFTVRRNGHMQTVGAKFCGNVPDSTSTHNDPSTIDAVDHRLHTVQCSRRQKVHHPRSMVGFADWHRKTNALTGDRGQLLSNDTRWLLIHRLKLGVESTDAAEPSVHGHLGKPQ